MTNMKRTKIEYNTPYTQYDNVNSYIMAVDCGKFYAITERQENRAYKNLTAKNVAPQYHCMKPVKVMPLREIRNIYHIQHEL